MFSLESDNLINGSIKLRLTASSHYNFPLLLLEALSTKFISYLLGVNGVIIYQYPGRDDFYGESSLMAFITRCTYIYPVIHIYPNQAAPR